MMLYNDDMTKRKSSPERFRFVDDLPEQKPTNRGSLLLIEFVAALKANPGKWAEYPIVMKPATQATIASNIRRGDVRAPKPFVGEQFEARVHEDVLYVRFIGGLVADES
jgi:hypothetical protein